MTAAEPAWGVDSEHGRLLDVLLCKPHNFSWLPTSAISRATLESEARFEPTAAHAQHAEMVAAYEDAGVRCHYLEPDPALAYQVFTRDSSAMGPNGPVITQLNQWWRRGEYAAAIRFYAGRGIQIRGMITAASLEGGDVIIVEPGSVLIGFGEGRTMEAAARQLAEWFEEDGWEARLQPFPDRFVHLDVLVAIVAEKLAAVCVEALPSGGGGVAARQGLRADRGLGRAGVHPRRQRDLARRRPGPLRGRRRGAERGAAGTRIDRP